MRRAKRTLIIFFAAAISLLISIRFYLYPPLELIQAGRTSFPLAESWHRRLDGIVLEMSGTPDGTILFARTSNSFYALRANNGSVIWRFALLPQIDHSAAIATDQRVYVTDSKSLLALDQRSGELLWSQKLPDPGGRVVAASNDIVVINQVGFDIRAYDSQTGSFLWNATVGRGFIQAHVDGNLVYIPDHGISASDAKTGKTVWEDGNDVIGSSIYQDGVIYYSSGNKIVAFDVRNRTELWVMMLPSAALSDFRIGEKFLFVTDASHLYALSKSDGNLIWQATVDLPRSPAVIGKNIFVLEEFARVIHGFELITGKELGSLRLSFPILVDLYNQDMIATGKVLVFSRGKELFAFGK